MGAFGEAVFLLHHRDHGLDGGHVGGIAGEDFVADGQPLGRDDQADVDLLAIGPLVARVAALRLFVSLGFALKISARHIVKQELELDAEPAPVTLVEMRAEPVLLRAQHVETAIEPRVIDAGKGDAEQVFERAVGIPALGHFQFAALPAKPRQGEDARRQFPRHLLGARRDQIAQERVQPQAPPEREREIDLPEIAHPLHAHSAQIHPFDFAQGRLCAHCGRGADSGSPSRPCTAAGARPSSRSATSSQPCRVRLPAPAPCPAWPRPAGAAHGRCARF
jgi:hypothetical protein